MGIRVAVNSGLLATEFGKTDQLHPDALAMGAADATKVFTPQPTIGAEAEILFQISAAGYFGVELDYTHLKGFNDNPPGYNYYLTPYFQPYQPDGYLDESPIKYNTHLWNLAVNYKYFFFPDKSFQPFVKVTGVVAFVGTTLSYKDNIDNSGILYARGTADSKNKKKWPAFHFGGGLGFNYDISDNLAFQIDGTVTVVNSGIVNGVPNFTYLQENGEEILRYNRRLSLTTQISAGLVYSIVLPSRGRGEGGKTDPNFPFYRKKR